MIDRRKNSRRKEPITFGQKPLNFSHSKRTSVTNFGWGSNGENVYHTTEDVRLALDRAFKNSDVEGIRALSKHFFKVSGIYARAARYLAYLPTYDYLIYPRIYGTQVDDEAVNREVITQLEFLESMKLKLAMRNLALETIVNGVSYRYLRRKGTNAVLQPLPVKWCRTVSVVNGFPTVEFDLRYFDTITNEQQRLRELNSYPPEIIEEYFQWKQDTSKGENSSERRQENGILDGGGVWILLNPKYSTAFFFNDSLQPILANSLFSILDLLEIKAIEKKKNENEQYNLITQKFPLDDDGDLIFDFSEIQQFHDGAVKIFADNDQTDVLTTFGDVSNIDLNEAAGQAFDYEPWKVDVYSELGISPQLFSTEGNMALEKSINADEAIMFHLVQQMEDWISYQLEIQFQKDSELDSKDKLFSTSLWFPPISVMNKKEILSSYKDTATLGYSKFLVGLAMGQSQISLMSLAVYENEILGLNNIMEPLKSSHTAASGDGGGSGGRPPLPDSEKSDKTIANMGG